MFSTFVSLTPDNLLSKALQGTRAGILARTNSFSTRDSSETLANLNLLKLNEPGVFQLLGNSSNFISGFAIHEEDTLEYLYRLQSDSARAFMPLLSRLRQRDKLLIGCNLPDWFGRALLRILNDERFVSKGTFEFIAPTIADSRLQSFLTQYSPNTLSFDGPVATLIEELWQRFPQTQQPLSASEVHPVTNGPSVFISYASENAIGARQIANRLLDLGFSDVWLDQKKLIAGDDWSGRINDAIESCDFFMPLLSSQADGRREGVFWEEWRLAIARSRRIQDAFLLPTGIDAEPASRGRYQRIAKDDTRIFFDKHLLHAPQGILSKDAEDDLQERCRRFQEANRGR